MPISLVKQRTKVGQGFDDIAPLIFLYDANGLQNTYSNGDSVSNWFDGSGNNFHMAQTGTARPTLVTNADAKGNAAARFNGSTQYMSCPTSTPKNTLLVRGNNGITFFAVGKHDATTTGGAYWSNLDFNAGVGAGPLFMSYRTAASTSYVFLDYANNANSTYYQYRGSTNIHNTLGIHYATYISTPSETFYVNGALETPTLVFASGNGAFDGNNSSTFIGAYFSGGSNIAPWNGDIYLVGAYQGVLSDAQRTELTNRLSARFQISV